MGFFKSIFGKDNDSATKVEDFSLGNQEKLQPNTDDVDVNNIRQTLQ